MEQESSFVAAAEELPAAPWIRIYFQRMRGSIGVRARRPSVPVVLHAWATAFIGTGTLSAVPMSVLLLTQMGVLVGVRSAARRAPA